MTKTYRGVVKAMPDQTGFGVVVTSEGKEFFFDYSSVPFSVGKTSKKVKERSLVYFEIAPLKNSLVMRPVTLLPIF